MIDPASIIALPTLVGAVRIGFGLMFLVKLAYSFDAASLVWAHRRPGSAAFFRALRVALFVSASCFTLGLFTGPAALVTYLLYLVLWRYASLYGMEDIVFHAMAFYFVFAGAGQVLSLDALLGTSLWGRLPAGTMIPELALAVAMGNIFLSAGVTKLPSPMWQRGLGAYYFFLMPNFRRLDTSWITRYELPIRIVNYAALAMEIFLLPALLFNAIPAGLLFWVMAFGFSISLSTIFVLTWIGEAMILGFLVVLWLILHQGSAGLAALAAQQIGLLHTPFGIAVALLLGATLLSAFWVSVLPYPKWFAGSRLLTAIDGVLRRISRHTWGLIPCIVFTESHMQGPVVYRVWATYPEGEREVFRIFGEDSNPGPDRPFRPAFYEVTSYKVAEACMELDAWGEVRTEPRRDFILHLAELIARKATHKFGAPPRGLTFRMRQIVPPPTFAGSIQPHLAKPWKAAFEVPFREGHAEAIHRLNDPILEGPTGRDLSRISFAFNPRRP